MDFDNASLRENGYAPIESYGLIGDGRTIALVATDGRIDWLPAPSLDSPPAFAAVLDAEVGGRIELAPAEPHTVNRRYRPGTPVLETTYRSARGDVTVVDSLNRQGWHPLPWTELARVVHAEDRPARLHFRVAPGRRFGDAEPWRLDRAGRWPLLRVGDQMLAVVTDGAENVEVSDHGVSGELVAEPDRPALLAVLTTDNEPIVSVSPEQVRSRVDDTSENWRAWRRQIRYDGPYDDAVVRSIEVLKLLTRAASGANAAAPTTSLPEKVGGKRNFDYRFAWVRDASFALDVLTGVGLGPDVHSALSWLLSAVGTTAPDVRPFYTLSGGLAPATSVVEGLAGWRGTSPVQIGNSATDQEQLGAYGDLLDAVWRYVRDGGQLDPTTGSMLAEMADRVCDLWRQRDSGLWELGDREHYTSSKIGCWVAVDRAARLAEQGELPGWHAGRWRRAAEEIHQWVDRHCWSETVQAYTMYAGTDHLDAAVLLAGRTGFCSDGDPRLLATARAIQRRLTAGGPLLYRYTGMQDEENAFVACTFWLVEAFAHGGDLDAAETVMGQMLEYVNDLGLLSEQIDPQTGGFRGNFPQGLSHLALIGAARAIHRARGGAPAS